MYVQAKQKPRRNSNSMQKFDHISYLLKIKYMKTKMFHFITCFTETID